MKTVKFSIEFIGPYGFSNIVPMAEYGKQMFEDQLPKLLLSYAAPNYRWWIQSRWWYMPVYADREFHRAELKNRIYSHLEVQ